jgi:SAM-dependent methyltransferase
VPLLLALLPLKRHSTLSFAPPPVRRVFEIGAGSGADLLEFRQAGWEVSGCEPSGFACATAARNGITLTNCNAEDADLPDGISCVYMNNVFEHLHDPVVVLAKARARLISGGLVVIVVPNHASWAARLFGAAWPGYDPPRHIWGYAPRALRGMFARAGFEIVSIDHKYPFSTFCWHAGLTGDRLDNARPPAPPRRLGRRINRMLGRGVIPIGMIAALAGRADYIRVVARKP